MSVTSACPLALISTGESVTLLEIRLPQEEKQRLHALGVSVGGTLRVVKSDFETGLIVALRGDTRLALNRRTAQKLIVQIGE